ncbi:MAG: hypothetical protein ACJ8CF_09925, partial [Microvirga sp.]
MPKRLRCSVQSVPIVVIEPLIEQHGLAGASASRLAAPSHRCWRSGRQQCRLRLPAIRHEANASEAEDHH